MDNLPQCTRSIVDSAPYYNQGAVLETRVSSEVEAAANFHDAVKDPWPHNKLDLKERGSSYVALNRQGSSENTTISY